MQLNYCRRCSTTLDQVESHIFTCQEGHTIFANPAPAVGIWLINNKNEVLIAIRGQEPGLGLYDAPGGFVDGAKETLEQACEREVYEELTLTRSQYGPLHYLTSGVNHYAYGNEIIPTMDVFFWAKIDESAIFSAHDDVASAKFMSIDDIHLNAVAFSTVRKSLETLKSIL